MKSIWSRPFIPADIGVYDAWRAAALSGVSKWKIQTWVRTEFFVPWMPNPPKERLWSWPDLLVLRAIDILKLSHSSDYDIQPEQIMVAVYELMALDHTNKHIHTIAMATQGRRVFFRSDKGWFGHAPSEHAQYDVINLAYAYAEGPDIIKPRPHIRIMPGKVSGQPHIKNSRITTSHLYAAHRNGYSLDAIATMYPDITIDEITEAIELEASFPQPRQRVSTHAAA